MCAAVYSRETGDVTGENDMRESHEIYFDAAYLAVAAAEARLAMSLAFADCDAVLVGGAVGHCGFG